MSGHGKLVQPQIHQRITAAVRVLFVIDSIGLLYGWRRLLPRILLMSQ
jgi:hypothetical protein